jgi:hypothetical protein
MLVVPILGSAHPGRDVARLFSQVVEGSIALTKFVHSVTVMVCDRGCEVCLTHLAQRPSVCEQKAVLEVL